MYIVLKTAPSDNDEIVNVFYCEDLTVIRNWVRQYIESDIKSLEYCPVTQGLKNITYELNDAGKNIELIKSDTNTDIKVNNNYIINTSGLNYLITKKTFIVLFADDSNIFIHGENITEMIDTLNVELQNIYKCFSGLLFNVIS